jgi:hypothetical protein
MGSDVSKISQADIIHHIKSWGPSYHQFDYHIANSGISGSVLLKMQEDEVDDFCDLIGATSKTHRLKFRTQFRDFRSKTNNIISNSNGFVTTTTNSATAAATSAAESFDARDHIMITSSLTQHVPLTLTLSQNMSRGMDYSALVRDGGGTQVAIERGGGGGGGGGGGQMGYQMGGYVKATGMPK